MLTLSWYTVNYFQVSFAKQDLIQVEVHPIKDIEIIKVDTNKNVIIYVLLESENTETNALLHHFNKNVPYKFLSSWLGSGSVGFP